MVGAALVLDAVVPLLLSGSLPGLASALHVPLDRVGLLFSGNFLGFVLAVPTSGVASERYGRRRVVTASIGLLGVSLLALARAPSLPWAMAAVVVVGAGSGAVQAVCLELVPEMVPGRPGYGLLLSQALFSIGAVLGPAVLLPVWGLSWRQRFLLLSLPVVLLFALAASGAGRRPMADAAPQAFGGVGRRLAVTLRSARVRRAVIAIALYDGVEVSFWGWLFTAVTRPHGQGPVWGVIELSTFWAMMGAGRLAIGRMADRVDLALVIRIEALAGIPALLIALLTRDHTLGLAASALGGLCLSAIWPSIIAHARAGEAEPTLVAATLMTASGLGGLAIPAAFGFAAAHAGWPIAAAGLTLLLVPVGWLLVPERTRAMPPLPEPATAP